MSIVNKSNSLESDGIEDLYCRHSNYNLLNVYNVKNTHQSHDNRFVHNVLDLSSSKTTNNFLF